MPKPTPTVKITVWYCVSSETHGSSSPGLVLLLTNPPLSAQLLLWPAQLQDRRLLPILPPSEVLWVCDTDDQNPSWSINNEPFLDGTRHATACLIWPGPTPMTGALDDTSFNFAATSRNSDYDRQEPSKQQKGTGAATRAARTETTRTKTHKTEKDREGKKGNPLAGHSHSTPSIIHETNLSTASRRRRN
ncbi:hypothetical protein CNYM01_12151 [Colletotrichum nymphaeae SA-01]|uniref:Uncharacterized protein n=1 Tax=Colletotrichum nymphaeae SA-01 TaxID=1460502 RepID=A0A135TR48_9PEZI|nr:hypothetical protein CNYM01_12151 [Colletotrichum nymphaeae SA-01]